MLAGRAEWVLGERFRLLALVDEGGLAAVYRAVDERDGGAAAIKLFHRVTAGLPEVRERFHREAALLRSLGARVGAAFRDAGERDDQPWLAVDFLDGKSLRDRLRATPGAPAPGSVTAETIDVSAGVRLVVELLELLATVHDAGVVHGDLKPGNVMVLSDGRARLLDFGSALSVGAPRAADAPSGTAAYAAPEQARAGSHAVAADPRADLYSVGVILFELACRRRPYTGDPVALLDAHARLAPPPPRSLVPDLSPALERVVLTSLAKDPAARFASARAMAGALRETPEATLAKGSS